MENVPYREQLIRIRYGPLKLSTLLKKTRYEHHTAHNVLKLIARPNKVGYLKAFKCAGHTYLCAVLEKSSYFFQADTFSEIVRALCEMNAFVCGYDGVQLFKRLDTSRFYLDPTSADKIIKEPKPRSSYEIENNPIWSTIPGMRRDLAKKYLTEQELEAFDETFNTFEVHELEEEWHDPIFEKYDIMAALHHDQIEPVGEDEMIRLLTHELLQTELTQDGSAVDFCIDMPYQAIKGQGEKNSAHAGFTVQMDADGFETKATLNPFSSMEACEIINDAKDGKFLTVRPNTVNPKDERVKEGKKEKQFQPMDASHTKLYTLFFGFITDQAKLRPDRASMLGNSLNGCVLDHWMRANVGIMAGSGYATIEELKKLKGISTDFAGFEYNHHPFIDYLSRFCEAMHYGNGCRDSSGKPQPHASALIGMLQEAQNSPSFRVGGGNVCFPAPPTMRSSGGLNTLATNTGSNGLYMMWAHHRYAKKHNRWRPEETGAVCCGMKNGDDGVVLKSELTEGIFKELSNMPPLKFSIEKQGPLISELKDGVNINNGVTFCKTNFVVEKDIVTAQRNYKNLHKVVFGNTSTVDPSTLISAAVNQSYNCYGNKRYYDFTKEWYDLLVNKFFPDGIPGHKIPEEAHTPSLMDVIPETRDFPTYEEIERIYTYKDEEARNDLVQSYERGVVFNIPQRYEHKS